MTHTVATAAATSLAVVSSLISMLPAPQYALPAAAVVLSIPQTSHAEVAIPFQEPPQSPLPVPLGEEAIRLMIKAYASKYGVSEGLMLSTVSCETSGTFDPTIRSRALYTFSDPKLGIHIGEQEQSYGLAQIHLPANPDVTIDQAKDPDFALDFMAKHLAKGETWRWTCIK